jgi:hypothetical protein
MTGGAPTVESKQNAELALQSLDRGSRNNPVISCGDTQNTHQAQHDITCSDERSATDHRSTRRRKRGEESGQDTTRDKPTSKQVEMRESIRESSNNANVPVGCHGIAEGEGVATQSMPYETVEKDNPVASSVQTVMFSDTRREDSSGIPEYYRNLPKQQNRDSGGSSSTIKRKIRKRETRLAKNLTVDATSV